MVMACIDRLVDESIKLQNAPKHTSTSTSAGVHVVVVVVGTDQEREMLYIRWQSSHNCQHNTKYNYDHSALSLSPSVCLSVSALGLSLPNSDRDCNDSNK
jgi:hypothetical protein